jgi:hypothetical protein
MLLIVTRTMASVGSINIGFGFSTKANVPFSMYVYASISFNQFYIINIIRPSAGSLWRALAALVAKH